jgi:hypothetical protein
MYVCRHRKNLIIDADHGGMLLICDRSAMGYMVLAVTACVRQTVLGSENAPTLGLTGPVKRHGSVGL